MAKPAIYFNPVQSATWTLKLLTELQQAKCTVCKIFASKSLKEIITTKINRATHNRFMSSPSMLHAVSIDMHILREE